MRSNSQLQKGSTVSRRLFLLVLCPLTALTATLGVVANDRWAERRSGADVVAQVDELRSLVSLQSAVYNERSAIEVEVRSDAYGVPASLGAGLLGLPELDSTYPATDAALAATTTLPTEVSGLLAAARAGYDQGDPEVIAAYDRVDDVVVERIIEQVDAMQSAGIGTADLQLAAVLQQLASTVLAFSASTDQTTGLADSWFGPEEGRFESQSQLGFQTARYDLAITEIDLGPLPGGLGASLANRTDPVSTAVSQLLTGTLPLPDGDGVSDLELIVNVFRASFARNEALGDLVALSADNVESVATRIANDAADAFIAALVVGSVAIAGSIVLSWRLAVSISGPMASVAARTRELQAGQIEASALELTGPRELRDVASAINDVSTNLGALEGKLGALARADLDDEQLAAPLPGRLGEALMDSVDTLSSSIADRHNLQARLGYQASHDALTGLANRAAVLERLSAALATAESAPVGLIFVDLDDFKRANDVFGHGTGDEVLVEVGRRLLTTCRPSDMVARLGGDEFLVVAQELDRVENLMPVAQRIIDVIAKPMPMERTGGLSLQASAGVAIARTSTLDALEFLSHADAALYLAKASDRRIGVFDEQLRQEIGERALIEQRLRSALRDGDLEVHYQPVLASDSLAVGQIEALVRWVGDHTYGPDVFIPVAEASDLVVDIDRFVLATATNELARLIADGVANDLSVAVNLSGRHLLHANVADHVAAALASSGLDPSRLIIEVTETALIADLDRAAEHLAALRTLGVRASVDDFGTGFTSISQLRRLPIDELKIDRSLVTELPGDETLVRVVRDLATHFGMTTVAEGVETQEQATFLRELGCSQLQGWLYARAMPVDDLRRWFAARSEVHSRNRVATADSP